MMSPRKRPGKDRQARRPDKAPPADVSEHALLRIVTENARVGLLIIDQERRYLYSNTTYARILGLPQRDLVGRPLEDVLPGIYHEQVAPQLDRAFGGERVKFDLRLPGEGGDRFYSVRCEPTAADDGRQLVVVVITEVTENRKRQLDSSRLAAIVESSELAIIGKDLNGVVTSWNAGAAHIFEYSAAEMIGQPITRLIPADRQDEERRILERVRSGEPTFMETVRQTGSGRLIDVSMMTSPIRDASGNIIGASTMARDISESKRASEAIRAEQGMRMSERQASEAALRVERDRAQRYLDAAEVILLALDTEGRVTLMNRKGSEVLGWTEADLLGRNWMDTCLVPRLRDTVRERFNVLLERGSSLSENTVLTRGGAERLVEWRSSVMRDDAGQVIGTFSSGTDVTERRALEGQYHQAQKMDAVGRLAAGVAHDFNNLVTAILGYCHFILTDLEPDDPHREDVAEINRAGERAAALTRQLLTFSRKQIVEPTSVDMNAVATGLRAMLERLIGEDVQIVLDLEPTLGRVSADVGQMEQVLVNLAVNARDAMPEGGRILIETDNVELDADYVGRHYSVQPGSYVSITVTDTGAGMTPEVQARIFEPFFTTKEAGKGTGLGLATVHGIVSAAGGSVAVYSELGKGTTFTVYLPRETGEVKSAPAPVAARPAGGGETVLVVEDADALRTLIKRILERQEYTVLTAANITDAQALFDSNDVDVIVTDVVMAGGSGPDLTKRLRATRQEVKVIYMSGYTEDAISHRGVLDPGIAFIHKPFTAEGLGQKIREVLDGRR
jgi:two-component system cell cycle sensor histidine kinase/response regulator CckA